MFTCELGYDIHGHVRRRGLGYLDGAALTGGPIFPDAGTMFYCFDTIRPANAAKLEGQQSMLFGFLENIAHQSCAEAVKGLSRLETVTLAAYGATFLDQWVCRTRRSS